MSYKPFKMKGHTLPGINQRKADRTADGRPGSSALQKKSPYKNVKEGYNPDGSVDKNSERYKKAMANTKKSKARKSKENELRETMKTGGDDAARQAQRELMSKGSISMDEKRRRDAENKKKEGGSTALQKKDNRSLYQKAKDEAKQIGKGVKGAVLQSDYLLSRRGVLDRQGGQKQTGVIQAFKEDYKKEEDKQAAKRKAGKSTTAKK